MLKTLLKLIVGSGLLLSAAISVEAQNPLLLTGRTTNVQVAEDKENVVLTLSLDLTIKNESQSNVILFAHDFQIMGHYIYQSADRTKPNLLFRQSSAPSFNRSPHLDRSTESTQYFQSTRQSHANFKKRRIDKFHSHHYDVNLQEGFIPCFVERNSGVFLCLATRGS